MVTGSNRPIRGEKTAVRIAQDIVRSLRREGKASGDRLAPEREMIELYGVGRSTLREALRYLELQGVLEIRPGPNGGPLVRTPGSGNLQNSIALLLEFSGANFRTIAESRLAIEPTLARLAAERITPEQREELDRSVSAMEQHINDQDVFLEENRHFHHVIAWSASNPLLAHLFDSMIGISDGRAFGTDYPRHRRTAILEAHRQILEAVKRADAEGASTEMERHILAFISYTQKKYGGVMAAPVTWEQFVP